MKKTQTGLILLDALCAGVLALGAALVILPVFGLQAEPLRLALSVIILLGLAVLNELRPWILPALLGGCFLLAVGIACITGKLYAFTSAIAGYVRWAVSKTAQGEPQLPVYLAAAAPEVLVFWAVLVWGRTHKLAPLWAVTLLAAALITYKAVWMPEGWQLPFFLLCGGVILFLPRASLDGAGRMQAQALGALLAVPVLGLGILIGPKADGEWRSLAVGHLVQDVQDFWEYHWGGLPAVPITSMRSMGLQPETDHLGGDIEPDEETVFTSTQNILLRGQALGLYTGHSWEDSREQSDGNFRLNSLFWQGRRRKAFGLTAPYSVSKPLLDSLMVEVNADVRSFRNFRSLFLPYRTQKVEMLRDRGELFFNMQGEAYWEHTPAGPLEYSVEAQAWNYRDKNFDQNMLFLEETLASAGGDPLFDQAAERYLQLPDTLPGWVRDLAEELTRDSGSPYSRAAALRDYLSENCEYTLTPGPADGEKDFVAEFLINRKGYCTYYATALTVLCRCAGIPARYVTGYDMVEDGRRYKATQATAHAWTEIYLEKIGWVPLDALSQDVFRINAPLPEDFPSGDAAQGPPVTPSPTPFALVEEIGTEKAEQKGANPFLLLWICPVIGLAFALIISKRVRSRRYRFRLVQKKHQDPAQAAEHCYAGLLRLLRLIKLRPQNGETLLAFWARAGERLPREQGTEWTRAGKIMDRLRFGGIPPAAQDVEFLCEAYRELEAYAQRVLGVWGWFLI